MHASWLCPLCNPCTQPLCTGALWAPVVVMAVHWVASGQAMPCTGTWIARRASLPHVTCCFLSLSLSASLFFSLLLQYVPVAFLFSLSFSPTLLFLTNACFSNASGGCGEMPKPCAPVGPSDPGGDKVTAPWLRTPLPTWANHSPAANDCAYARPSSYSKGISLVNAYVSIGIGFHMGSLLCGTLFCSVISI